MKKKDEMKKIVIDRFDNNLDLAVKSESRRSGMIHLHNAEEDITLAMYLSIITTDEYKNYCSKVNEIEEIVWNK